ncbi:hypothetical protein L484_010162 [Morus notabilis]|uniref:Uncharacterized protein n=1 Tax=Morus notabilis TaxID=981085 RepID=W9R9D2_9ROSA|nr:hypothetical protein L484_010162 [Morus notabilis]
MAINKQAGTIMLDNRPPCPTSPNENNYITSVNLTQGQEQAKVPMVNYHHVLKVADTGSMNKMVLCITVYMRSSTSMLSADAIDRQLNCLDINRESRVSYHKRNAIVPFSIRYQEQTALILDRREGTIVPYAGSFDPIKKPRPRPKVDLDNETNRVWKLLLENINSKDIDGTDEDKAKWGEEERNLFRGRADSFVARMHIVQESVAIAGQSSKNYCNFVVRPPIGVIPVPMDSARRDEESPTSSIPRFSPELPRRSYKIRPPPPLAELCLSGRRETLSGSLDLEWDIEQKPQLNFEGAPPFAGDRSYPPPPFGWRVVPMIQPLDRHDFGV